MDGRRGQVALIGALIFACSTGSSIVFAQEYGTVPGAIPNPGTYQGSMQLQQEYQQQQQQFQQQQQEPPQYYAPEQQPQPAPSSNAPPSRRDEPGTWVDDPAAAAMERGDYATALRLVRRDAAKGVATSQHNLGYMYENGLGLQRDYTKAFFWYRKSAAQDFPEGMNEVGRMYALGRGVPKDNVQAYVWFTLAATSRVAGREVKSMATDNQKRASATLTRDELAKARQILAARH